MDSQEKVEETIESREWYLAAHAPEGIPTSDHLKLRTFSISLADESTPENHVVVKILYISVDPYLRAIMTGIDDGLCLPQFQINQVQIIHFYFNKFNQKGFIDLLVFHLSQ